MVIGILTSCRLNLTFGYRKSPQMMKKQFLDKKACSMGTSLQGLPVWREGYGLKEGAKRKRMRSIK